MKKCTTYVASIINDSSKKPRIKNQSMYFHQSKFYSHDIYDLSNDTKDNIYLFRTFREKLIYRHKR